VQHSFDGYISRMAYPYTRRLSLQQLGLKLAERLAELTHEVMCVCIHIRVESVYISIAIHIEWRTPTPAGWPCSSSALSSPNALPNCPIRSCEFALCE